MNLSMRGIVKSFGANDVLKSVDFSLKGGEVCALLGENGAGQKHADEYSGRRAAGGRRNRSSWMASPFNSIRLISPSKRGSPLSIRS